MAMSDAPDKTSKDWQAMEDYWRTVNDFLAGAQVVRDAGERYLPKFPNETKKDYDFRVKTGKFTNVYLDIVEGLSQKPFSKELTIAEGAPERLASLIEDIDGRGNHLHVFAAQTFFAGINKAIDWILVDYTRAAGLRTVQQEREAGVRPYWVHVPADKVIRVESKVIAGREQLTLVHILESPDRVRIYKRDGSAVTWEVHAKNESGEWVLDDDGVITIGVIPLVPFITGRRKGATWQFEPAMRGAVDLQRELYQEETSLKYIKTMTCFPMLAGNGVPADVDADGKPKSIPVGPKAVLYAPPGPDGSHGEWKWIGTDAASLTFLAEQIKETKRDLREIGKQPLTAQSGNLTVIATAFASAKGNSAVQAWALGLKDALENALKLTSLWLAETYEPEVVIHTDFGIENGDDKAPEYLLKMRKSAPGDEPDISQRTLWDEFKRRGILSAEFDPDIEIDERLFESLDEL
tara:strand:+ start:15945 stop:17336 length:1392 start_codon:yes stop_codon:yes gene_type:complete